MLFGTNLNIRRYTRNEFSGTAATKRTGGVTMANTFDWVEIKTRDVEETATFYENLFGWKVIEKETAEGFEVWIFDTGGEPRVQNLRRGGIWARPKGEPLGVVVYIVVDDIGAILQKVTELGGKVVADKTPQGPAYRAYFTDPSGNLFGLWEETP
jgi:predicted enzyme related to lactoylglutathione lyase